MENMESCRLLLLLRTRFTFCFLSKIALHYMLLNLMVYTHMTDRTSYQL